MKTLMTIATLVAATSALADFHPNTYDWNNDMIASTVESVATPAALVVMQQPQTRMAYTQDNGIFGYNPYNIMDPRWMMEEMSNVID